MRNSSKLFNLLGHGIVAQNSLFCVTDSSRLCKPIHLNWGGAATGSCDNLSFGFDRWLLYSLKGVQKPKWCLQIGHLPIGSSDRLLTLTKCISASDFGIKMPKKSQSRLLILFFLFYFSEPENRLSTDKYLKPQNLFWVRSVKSWIRASLLQMQIALLVLFLMWYNFNILIQCYTTSKLYKAFTRIWSSQSKLVSQVVHVFAPLSGLIGI